MRRLVFIYLMYRALEIYFSYIYSREFCCINLKIEISDFVSFVGIKCSIHIVSCGFRFILSIVALRSLSRDRWGVADGIRA